MPDSGTHSMVSGKSEALWEIALCNSESTRYVLAASVPSSELWTYVATALEESSPFGWREPGVLVTRMDQTPEAKRAKWEADFYDVRTFNRKGKIIKAKYRRYKPAQIEKDWVKMIEADKKAKKLAAAEANRHETKEVF